MLIKSTCLQEKSNTLKYLGLFVIPQTHKQPARLVKSEINVRVVVRDLDPSNYKKVIPFSKAQFWLCVVYIWNPITNSLYDFQFPSGSVSVGSESLLLPI